MADLKALPEPPRGVSNCPAGLGGLVQVWFSTAHDAVSFRIGFGGCGFDIPSHLDDLGPWPAGVQRPAS